MHVLPFDKRVRVITTLVEGNSIRSTERLCAANRETIMRLGVDVGEACHRLHDALVGGLQVGILEIDEIWSFVGKKQRRLRPSDSADFGDCYTFLGLDANRKAIISYVVGKRDGAHALTFCRDLRARIINRPQISSDGFNPYVEAIERAFGRDVDYGQIIKTAVATERDDRYYTSMARVPIMGTPAQEYISTSYVERLNLTLRMSAKRFERRTNGFSKKLRHHAAAVALYVGHYNFCRVHETLRTTPAVAVGVTGHVWSIAELMDAALSIAPAPPPAPAVTPPPGPAPAPAVDPGQAAPDLARSEPVAPTLQRQLSLFPDDRWLDLKRR